MTQLLAGLGVRRIIAFDLLEDRLALAKRFKATDIIQVSFAGDMIEQCKNETMRITEGEMCDVVVDMVGHQDRSIDLCAQLAKENGTVLLYGLPPAKGEVQMSIQSQDFIRNIHYVCSSSPEWEYFQLAIEMLEQQRFDPAPLFTHTVPFSRFPEAYEMVNSYKDGVVKVLLTFDD